MNAVDPNIGQFTVSATNLLANINAIPPAGFEISFNADNGYGSGLTLNEYGGRVTNTVIYVRLTASANAGANTGDVTLTSTSVLAPVPVYGDVEALPIVNTIKSQTVTNGQSTAAINFAGTITTFAWTNDTPGIGLAASGTGNIASFKAVNTGKTPVTATITVTPAVNPGYAYIANGISNTVSVVNTSTNQVVSTISTPDPAGVAVSRDGQRAYVTSDAGGSLSVINTQTNKIINVIAVDQRPEGVVVSADGKTVYVANYQSSDVSVVDPVYNNVNTIQLAPYGASPIGIAISPDGSRLYVCCGLASSLVVINTSNNQIIGTVKFSPNPNSTTGPISVAVSPDGKTLYVSNDALYVIDASTYTITTTVPENFLLYGICISPDGNTLYGADGLDNSIMSINLTTYQVIATVPGGSEPHGVSLTADGYYLYVTNYLSKSVTVVNTASNMVVTTIPVGDLPDSFGNFIKPGNDCDGTPVTFTITVKPAADTTTPGQPDNYPLVTIPNTFTPNGDGINDTWNIKDIENYPNCTVNVFSRYGSKIYSSIGYPVAWDGTYKGTALPVGTYYYVIDLKNGIPPLSGYVAIIK